MKDHLICLCSLQDCLICQVFSAGLSYLSSVQCRTFLISVKNFLKTNFEETKLIFCRQRRSRGQPEARSLNYTTVS